MSGMSTPIVVFCSSAPADEPWLRKLENHLALLKRQGLITIWHNRQLTAGINWQEAIETHLKSTSIILEVVTLICRGVHKSR
jgi:hypothetical protein